MPRHDRTSSLMLRHSGKNWVCFRPAVTANSGFLQRLFLSPKQSGCCPKSSYRCRISGQPSRSSKHHSIRMHVIGNSHPYWPSACNTLTMKGYFK